MWKNEYEERLQPADRILLQTIYSLTATFIRADLVRQCFDRRISGNPMIDKTVDQFSKSLVRLSEGFISILDIQGKQNLSMQNPSVNDFLDGRLKTSPLERNDLIQSICTLQQMRLLSKSDQLPYAIQLLQTGKIDQFIFPEPAHRTRFIACTILSSKLCIEKFKNELLEYFVMPGSTYLQLNSSFFNPREQMKNLLLPELWNFYKLKTFFSQPGNLATLLSKMDLENAAVFIKEIDPYFQDDARSVYVHEVHGFLKEAIWDFCDADACDYQYALSIEHAVNQATDIYPDGSYIDENEAAALLETEIKDEVLYDLRRMISPLPKPFCEMINSIDEDDIFVSGADFLVEEYLSSQIINSEPRKESPATNSEDYASIDAMFL